MKAQLFRLLLPVCVLSVFTGCASGPLAPTATSAGNTISGRIHGGQQPVVGALIKLYSVGTSGDGSLSSQLLTKSVTTDVNGSFTIAGDFSCANATQVYLTATGGNPGVATSNPNLLMMAALGPCTAITTSTYVWVNELTTVAAAYALAPYASSATSIGSGASDAAALASAFTLANQYVNTTTGQAPGIGIPSGYTDPTALLNTLANILSTCVNSTGGVANDNSTPCGSLFGLTPSSNGAAPTDTFTAALNLAKNPGLQTAGIFNLAPSSGPFQPALPQTPPDFNVHITAANGIPSLNLQPTTLPFPDEAPNGPIEYSDFSFENSYPATDITIYALNVIGPAASDFATSYVPCTLPYTLGPSGVYQGCTIDISARPSALGERIAYLQIITDAPDSPQYVKLYMSGTAVPTTPTYLYLSTAGSLSAYNPVVSCTSGFCGLIASAAGLQYYGALNYNYVGNFYSFGQLYTEDANFNLMNGAFVVTTNGLAVTGSGGPAPKQTFNPTPPAGYLFNGAATSLTGATNHFAVDNDGQTYIPVQTSDAIPQMGIAVYPPNSVGATAPSFVLTGYGGQVVVDPSGDLLTLTSNGDIAEYQYGVLSNSKPYNGMPLSTYLGTATNARVIDLATDGAGSVYALIYGTSGYEIVSFTNAINGNPQVHKFCIGAVCQLNQPTAIAVDGLGEIYVADISPTTQKKVVLFYNVNGSQQGKAPDAIIDASGASGPVTVGLAVR